MKSWARILIREVYIWSLVAIQAVVVGILGLYQVMASIGGKTSPSDTIDFVIWACLWAGWIAKELFGVTDPTAALIGILSLYLHALAAWLLLVVAVRSFDRLTRSARPMPAPNEHEASE
jgi:hypothetical protein